MPATISFFRVSLACEAASHIGCGTRARPVLADLERGDGVREAWLSRDGTALGVVWDGEARDPEGVRSILRRHGVEALELKGAEHQNSREYFASGGWCRSTQVQDLSAEEARFIVARLIRRLGQDMPLPASAAERLEDACARVLAVASASCASTRREQIAAALLETARDVLDPHSFQAFAAAVSLGHRPLPGEG